MICLLLEVLPLSICELFSFSPLPSHANKKITVASLFNTAGQTRNDFVHFHPNHTNISLLTNGILFAVRYNSIVIHASIMACFVMSWH